MNKDDNNDAPVNDDAELAKVLEGINGNGNSPTLPTPGASGLQFEETPAAHTNSESTLGTPGQSPDGYGNDPLAAQSDIPNVEVVADQPVYPTHDQGSGGPLEGIKKHALEELRPLVDKLDLPADEKFDTLLLIIRSTDDQSLVSSAYETAKLIQDETKRAQALLDVIKEIDYFANQSKK